MLVRATRRAMHSRSRASVASLSEVINRFAYGAETPLVGLDRELPGFKVPQRTSADAPEAPRITQLAGGLRVVSTDSAAPVGYLGVFLGAGSRHEGPHNRGVAHALATSAFLSRGELSSFALTRAMGLLGGSVVAQTGREHTFLGGEALREYAPFLVREVLGRSLFDRRFNAWEVRGALERYASDREQQLADGTAPDVLELVHSAAYGSSTLGVSMLPTPAEARALSLDTLEAFAAQHVRPSRVVVSAVGVDHDDLVNMVEEFWVGAYPDAFHGPGAAEPAAPAEERARYVGGEVRVQAPGDQASVALAFETSSWHGADLVPMCVLQQLLGGGGAFSAGGPGKGMYSRLYDNVLNMHGFVHSVSSFNGIYTDSGLFGVWGTSDAADAGSLTAVIARELRAMLTTPFTPEEVSRAKNMLKTAVLTSHDSRASAMEEYGRQVLTYGKVESAAQLAARIDAVTGADLQRVAAALLKTPLSFAASGDVTHVPTYAQVNSFLASK